LFHYLLWQDVATEYASADSHYPYYESANAAFARKIAEVYRPGDLIWVHDYHLLLVPRLLRESIPDAVIGLFVHTPFPSSEVFRCLPRRKEILDGMLGSNLICFQVLVHP
jgi:trehalose 6-phosphate synthase/phosphatase